MFVPEENNFTREFDKERKKIHLTADVENKYQKFLI